MWSARNVKSDRQKRYTRTHYYYDFDLSRGMHRGDYWWWRQGISPASSSIHIGNNELNVISLVKLCLEMQVYCSCKRRGKQSDGNYWHGPSRGFFIPSIHPITDWHYEHRKKGGKEVLVQRERGAIILTEFTWKDVIIAWWIRGGAWFGWFNKENDCKRRMRSRRTT